MGRLTLDAVINPDLLACITAAYGLEHSRVGLHVLRDDRGWVRRDERNNIVGAMTVRDVWVAEIRPAHLDPACLVVLATERERLGVFAIETHPWFAEYPPHIMPIVPPTMVSVGPIALDAGWDDPVASALRHLDGWTAERQLALDGRGYTLFADTSDARLAVEFSNPRTPSLQELEQALLHVAHTLATRDAKGVIAAYVESWAPYAGPN